MTEDDSDHSEERNLDNSRQLDVHRWSDYPEVNTFVDLLYNQIFSHGREEIQKRHLKVILLDLYVAWTIDPSMCLSIFRDNNRYRAKSRYNELKISRKTSDIADILIEEGFIEDHPGFYDRREGGQGRVGRIWPAERLIELFRSARFGLYDINIHPNRQFVILRDKDPDDKKARNIEYVDTPITAQMNEMLKEYNKLLQQTYIDIPDLEHPWIEHTTNKGLERTHVSQCNKIVERKFNRSSFEFGGRFYGGWWQQCPKEWRERIFINDSPTNEVDFSGLHTVLLYALNGISYWLEIAEDPYTIEPIDFLEDDTQRRAVCKGLMLTLINAKNPKAAYKAFRDKATAGTPEKSLTDKQLSQVHHALAEKHEPIADFYGSDMGIKLMRMDSDIAEIVLSQFMMQGIPALSIHDSFIVPCGHEDQLIQIMSEAFEKVTSVPLGPDPSIAVKEKQLREDTVWASLGDSSLLGDETTDRDIVNIFTSRLGINRTDRYQRNLQSFKDWIATTPT